MASPLTAADLDAIEQRADAATPGPWVTEQTLRSYEDTVHYAVLTRDKLPEHPWSQRLVFFAAGGCGHVTPVRWHEWRAAQVAKLPPGEAPLWRADERIAADCAFAAHARTDVPALVAEVRALRALLAEALTGLDAFDYDATPDGLRSRIRAALGRDGAHG